MGAILTFLMSIRLKKGFTLLEVLLVVAAIALLAGIVIIAITPNGRLGDTHNSQRRSDLNTILNVVYQYSIDNNGAIPSDIPMDTTCGTSVANSEICQTGASDCTGYVDLGVLTTNQTYLLSLPLDPVSSVHPGTGYYISRNNNGRISVCAPGTEQSVPITVTR